jgi:deoxyribose-phosphate aldolase
MDTFASIAKMIDHSLLQPSLSDIQIQEGCELAAAYRVATACVKPVSVVQARNLLQGSGVGICAVVGFPHGNSLVKVKAYEADLACQEGACEIDMVINTGKLLSGSWEYVEKEIREIMEVTHSHNGLIKVIFENDFLKEDADKIRLCEICTRLEVDFVKTSTGYGFVKGTDGRYGYEGATVHDVTLMRRYCGPEVQIKAAGGIRTLDDLLRFRDLGCTRFGATATAGILEEAKKRYPETTDPKKKDQEEC